MSDTDQQLQLALAKMLPEILRADFGTEGDDLHFEWLVEPRLMRIRDAEWLHVCWLVEQTLSDDERKEYTPLLMTNWWGLTHASWQQRATALAKVKGVEL